MDLERAGRDDVTAQIDSLKRWCAARLHDRAYRGWVIFRFPETLDYWRLVDVQRPRPELPEWMVGPDDRSAPPRRLQADRRAHEARAKS